VQIQQLHIKFAARDRGGFDLETLTPVFHRWIRERRLPHRLLIDVADYRHVEDGPGVFIVADECHVGVDLEGGLGVFYSRKRDQPGDVTGKLREAFFDVATVCALLAEEPTVALEILPGQVEIRVVSRLSLDNSSEAFTAFQTPLVSFLKETYGVAAVRASHIPDPGEPFACRAVIDAPPALAAIVDRLTPR
jgi:hypothetical protein